MEWITNEIIGFVLGMIVLFVAMVFFEHKERRRTKEIKNLDTNIEWYGPDVYLKEKMYEQRDCDSDRETNRADEDRPRDNLDKIESERIQGKSTGLGSKSKLRGA